MTIYSFIQDFVYCNRMGQTKVWTQFHWTKGGKTFKHWGERESTGHLLWLTGFTWTKSKLSHVFVKGKSFTTWSKASTAARLLTSHRDWGIGLLCLPLCWHIKARAPRSGERQSWVVKLTRFLKIYITNGQRRNLIFFFFLSKCSKKGISKA